ncbi:hypothetical protein [Planktothricoides raciborskii]|uniref:Uncharacterized protein n=2 Tax=Planktothricoides raciborskii TaxID=132608 RepID=A0AAU8JD25_9CYAN|nr:hypothetical protein [Planktothricoides raciborskii]MBD2545851.1 hypothetical protein [Planktothricoides raciborskii FACHB-1370]MBD2584109.1 hypothetical protein [Planktothricoides raciborskii FACHB-1261]
MLGLMANMRSRSPEIAIAVTENCGMRSQLFFVHITESGRSHSTKNQTVIANLQLLDHGCLI